MKKVRWGVIGAGGIADRRTIPGMMLSDEAELIAVMEINDELAENLRAKYGAKRAYTDHKALLADPEVDVVYIASPVNCHKEQAIDAARAKKDILLEKPMGLVIDYELNNKIHGKECLISKPDSKIRVYIIPTNEELVIARDTVRLLGL